MDIKIYYDGKIDVRNEMKWSIKKGAWHALVWLDCVFTNQRLRYTADEKRAVHELAMSFARGERRV